MIHDANDRLRPGKEETRQDGGQQVTSADDPQSQDSIVVDFREN